MSVFMGSYSAIKWVYLVLYSILDFKQTICTSLPKCVTSKAHSHCFLVPRGGLQLTVCAHFVGCSVRGMSQIPAQVSPRLLREVFFPLQSVHSFMVCPSHAPRDDTQMYPLFPTSFSLKQSGSRGHRWPQTQNVGSQPAAPIITLPHAGY